MPGPTKPIAFTYDQGTNGIGRLTGLQDASGSTNWSYDPLGRVTSRTQVHAGSGATLTTGYAWSPGGRLTEVTYPSGAKVGYAFLNGRISSITLKGQGSAADTPILATVVYHPFGPAKSWTWGNGTAYTRTFDADGRIAAFPLASAARQVAYDLASRITGITDTDPTRSFTYGYDLLDRLTSQSVGAGGDAALNQTLTYDAVGNRTTQTLGTVSRTYTTQATSNRLLSVSGFRTNTFDAMGNLINDGTQTWTYDDRARMKTHTGAAGLTTYAVNGLGQRVQKVNATLTTRYAFDENGRLLGEYDGTGTPNQETVWLEDLPVAVLKKPPPSTDISTCYTAFAANERLEVRSGKPGAADWEWGVGANTQQSGQLATIANVNWASGVAIKFVLAYNGTGGGTITLYNSQTNAQLATTSYTNATNPLRVGNAVKLYLKSTAGIGTGMKIRATITKINQQAQSIDLETAGDNTFSEKSAYAEVIPDAGTPGMTVEGTVTLTFTGSAPPTGSRLNMTLNAGSAPCAGGGTGGTTTAGASQVFYVYADQIGSPRRITTSDAANKVVWAWDNLDAFGANLADEDPDADGKAFTYNLRFPGQVFDAESGMHYNYFRDYDPAIGRYIESDPIGLKGGLNTYAYVYDSPLHYSDPKGLSPGMGGSSESCEWYAKRCAESGGTSAYYCRAAPLACRFTPPTPWTRCVRQCLQDFDRACSRNPDGSPSTNCVITAHAHCWTKCPEPSTCSTER